METAPTIIGQRIRVPEPPPGYLRRPRLTALIDELARETGVVVINATAGASKTSTAATAARATAVPVAWLTCDAFDNALGRFVTYLQAAFGRALGIELRAGTDALAAGLAPTESAALLAEALSGREVILVLDGTEVLTRPAWEVVGALIRYGRPAARFILAGRREPPLDTIETHPGSVRVIDDSDLAFTMAEAEAALGAQGAAQIDAAAAVEATGGWVTGVLFEAWRLHAHIRGTGGEADPLGGYLASHIVDQLSSAERELLVSASVLTDITAARAQALGVENASAVLATLARTRLPGHPYDEGATLRLHPRFREYLERLLKRRDPQFVAEIRERHGALLESEGADEEAVEAYLDAGRPTAALDAAGRVVEGVIERGDLTTAARWLERLRPVTPPGSSSLTSAELMLAISASDLTRAVQIADRLAARGELADVVAASPRTMALICWAYLHAARIDDVDAILSAVPAGPESRAIRYAAQVVVNVNGGPLLTAPPQLTGAFSDALVLIGHYSLGRIGELVDVPVTGWADVVASPWLLAGRQAAGQTQQCLELYELARARSSNPVLEVFVGAELLLDAALHDRAREVILSGRAYVDSSGSLGLLGLNGLSAVRLALEVDRDPARAKAIIGDLRTEGADRFAFIAEAMTAWHGLASLMQDDLAAARADLRDAVASMRTGRRILKLPAAAVWLAEAEWRAGDESAADAAADLALAAAEEQGSNHLLLQALATFEGVLARRLDAEDDPNSPWLPVAQAARARVAHRVVSLGARRLLHIHEFGERELELDGVTLPVGIAKAHETLSWLATAGVRAVSRTAALDVLFDGRTDKPSRNYLRQALHRLRATLPEDVLTVTDTEIRLAPGVRLSSQSVNLERALAEAVRLRGVRQLTAISAALDVYARGPFLPGVRGQWADRRDLALAAMVADAREQAATVALAVGQLDRAEAFAQAVVDADPYRESSWRVLMQAAQMRGDDARVVAAYQAVSQVFAELGSRPSPSTQRLLTSLRR